MNADGNLFVPDGGDRDRLGDMLSTAGVAIAEIGTRTAARCDGIADESAISGDVSAILQSVNNDMAMSDASIRETAVIAIEITASIHDGDASIAACSAMIETGIATWARTIDFREHLVAIIEDADATTARAGGDVGDTVAFSPPPAAIHWERAVPLQKTFEYLYDEACRLCAYSYRERAQLFGVSLRSVQRHYGRPPHADLGLLVQAVRAHDVNLARELAQAAGLDLAKLGLLPPPPPDPPPPRVEKVYVPTPVEPPPARREHADSVLLAAAHAFNLPPEQIRPAVAAAIERAAELGVSVQGLAEHLAQPLGKGKAEAPSAAPSASAK